MSKTRLDVNDPVKTSFRGINLYIPAQYKKLLSSTGYEKLSIDLFLCFLEPESVFLDIGTHVGLFTLLAGKKLKDKGKIYSFEPIPDNVEVLKSNLKLNSIQNVKIINEAISSESGKSVFKIRKDTGLSGFYEHPLGETVKEIKVKTSTVDSYFRNKKVDFLKIDTEGHELSVLEGAKETLKNNPQAKMLIELNPGSLSQGNRTPEELLEYIISLGYEIYAIDDMALRAYRLTEKPEKWREIFPEYGYANLLCLPKGTVKSILFFSHSNSIYGAERTMAEIAKALQEQKILVTIAKPSGGLLSNLLEQASIPTIDVAGPAWWYFSKNNKTNSSSEEIMDSGAQNLSQCISIIDKLDFDYIATNTIVFPWPAAAAKILAKPHFWFLHEFTETLKSPFDKTEIMNYINNNSDKIIVASKALKKHLSKYLTSSKLQVVYPPIELKSAASNIRIYKNRSALHIVSIGSIGGNKRQLDLVKAVRQLYRSGIKVELAIIGGVTELEYKKKIDKYITDNELGDLVSIFNETDNTIPFIRQADVLIVSSEKEGFGRTVIEGMLLSKVVIATRSGGPEEIIKDGVDGFLYTPGNIDELEKILVIISKDKKLQRKISKAAQINVHDKLAEHPISNLVEFILKNNVDPKKTTLFNSMFIAVAKNNIRIKLDTDRILERIKGSEVKEHQYQAKIKELNIELQEIKKSKAWKLARALQKTSGRMRPITKTPSEE